MVHASRAEQEFRNWVDSLDRSTISPDEAQIINLVAGNFADLAAKGAAGGSRGKRIAQLYERNRASLPSELPRRSEETPTEEKRIQCLKDLSIGPFRGFVKTTELEFSERFTFVYGPNGTGKSSLIDGLEFCMLGNIQEATAKRFEADSYARNARLGRYDPPTLRGVTDDQEVITVQADAAAFRYCFVEKNRIDSFARISATTPADQSSRIAALFGLDEFAQFVKGFSESLDPYLPTVSEKQSKLDELRAACASDKEFIASAPERRSEIGVRWSEIAEQVDWSGTPAELLADLDGDANDPETTGRLKLLDQAIESEIRPALVLPSVEDFDSQKDALAQLLASHSELDSEFARQQASVVYRDLYKAVSQLTLVSRDICPVCLTPVDQASRNPFSAAAEQLEMLQSVSELEGRMVTRWQEVFESFGSLRDTVISLRNVASQVEVDTGLPSPPRLSVPSPTQKAPGKHEIDVFLNGCRSRDVDLSRLAEAAEVSKNAADQAEEIQKSKKAERDLLRDLRDRARQIQADYVLLQKTLKDAGDRMQRFEAENESLAKEAELEIAICAQNQRMCSAYTSFRNRLRAYKDELPAAAVSRLSELTTELYVMMNEEDQEHEKLASISLPASANEAIRIRYEEDETGTEHDALHVLSEGHLRCLGLAILLAKNVEEECPLLIFDDVVNAIDDEHRLSIASLLCCSDHFSDKQLIVTSHGEEFMKTLEHQLEASAANSSVSRINFRPSGQNEGISAHPSTNPRHYLAKAESLLSGGSVRDALSECRPALEHISGHLFRRLRNGNYDVLISVRTRDPQRPPELRSQIDGLERFLREKLSSADIVAIDICNEIEILKQSSHWAYLNSGSHHEEGRGEFQYGTVRKVLDSLMRIEALVKTKGWPREIP